MPTLTSRASFDSGSVSRWRPRSPSAPWMDGVGPRATRARRTASRPSPGRVRRPVEETARRRDSRCRARSGWLPPDAQTRYAAFRPQGSLVVLASSPQSRAEAQAGRARLGLPIVPSEPPGIAARAAGRRDVGFEDVVHDHAVGAEPPTKRADGLLHAR